MKRLAQIPLAIGLVAIGGTANLSSLKLRTRGKNMHRASQVTRRIALQAAGMTIALITVLAAPAITPVQGYSCLELEDICEQDCGLDYCDRSKYPDTPDGDRQFRQCLRSCTSDCQRRYHCRSIGTALKQRAKKQTDCDGYRQCINSCDCSDVPPHWTCRRWISGCKRDCRADFPGCRIGSQ